MSRLLSLIAVLLFVFNVSLIAARPQSFRNRSPTPIDVSGLNTNAKRFSRGLGPLRPLVKRRPTGVDCTSIDSFDSKFVRVELMYDMLMFTSCKEIPGLTVLVRDLLTRD